MSWIDQFSLGPIGVGDVQGGGGGLAPKSEVRLGVRKVPGLSPKKE